MANYSLANVSAPDRYDGSTLLQPLIDCVRVDFFIQANPIYYRLFVGQAAQDERYLPALSGSIVLVSLERKCSGVEFRNANPGNVAIVTVELLTEGQLPDTG